MNRQEKAQVVEDLKERLSRSRMTVVTDYKGLTVDAMNRLRADLRETGTEFKVVKNTLLRLASQDTPQDKMRDLFKGPVALALVYKDAASTAKVITEFMKKNQHLQVKGGILSDRVLSEKDVGELGKLPERDVLLAQMLSAMNAVPTGFVRVLAGVLQKFMGTLVAVRDKKEGESS